MFVTRFMFSDSREYESHGNHITLQRGNVIPTPIGGFQMPLHLIPTVGPTSLKNIYIFSSSLFFTISKQQCIFKTYFHRFSDLLIIINTKFLEQRESRSSIDDEQIWVSIVTTTIIDEQNWVSMTTATSIDRRADQAPTIADAISSFNVVVLVVVVIGVGLK